MVEGFYVEDIILKRFRCWGKICLYERGVVVKWKMGMWYNNERVCIIRVDLIFKRWKGGYILGMIMRTEWDIGLEEKILNLNRIQISKIITTKGIKYREIV